MGKINAKAGMDVGVGAGTGVMDGAGVPIIGEVAISRSAIARATGTDVAHISRIFSGKSRPSLQLAARIADHLGISLDSLCRMLGIERAQLPGDGDVPDPPDVPGSGAVSAAA